MLAAQFLTRRAHDGAMVQPVVLQHSDVQLLSGVEAFVRIVGDVNVKSAVGTRVVVTSRAPVLPLAGLMARPLFPHLLAVLKALALLTVLLQREILLSVRIVLHELALRAAHGDIFAPPRELLDVRTVVGEGNRPAVVLELLVHVI